MSGPFPVFPRRLLAIAFCGVWMGLSLVMPVVAATASPVPSSAADTASVAAVNTTSPASVSMDEFSVRELLGGHRGDFLQPADLAWRALQHPVSGLAGAPSPALRSGRHATLLDLGIALRL
ncbi:hypothetical protein [Roseimaritima sediminicola]|uniref:hypothetical protein n=1 Tax=Roseimaritima sediminicola TaxID=2662066 RepID=UPI0012983E23|nr:hypothetical protein [Roseimaritima sediminicola]